MQSDLRLSAAVLGLFPDAAKSLQDIANTEQKIDNLKSRQFSKYNEVFMSTTTKTLRVFIHHTYNAATTIEKASFTVSIEGHLLCPISMKYTKFGQFFEKIKFQLDKKAQYYERSNEWTAAIHPDGVKSDCFRAKIYADKSQILKIFLHRSNDLRPRYEISSKLRIMLPDLPSEATEEEILIAIWIYIHSNQLFTDSKDKRNIKTDQNLRDLTGSGSEFCLITTLYSRIKENLSLSNIEKPIIIEYPMTYVSTQATALYGPVQFSKAGGKVVEFEVECADYVQFERLRSMNSFAEKVDKCDQVLETVTLLLLIICVLIYIISNMCICV